jgi:DNA modification methylase
MKMSEPATKSKQAPDEAASKPALLRPARAELVWEGKYDTHGRRVAPLRVALPFQTVETVNESAQDRQRNLQFGPGFREQEWRNRLIWGDKKYVLPSLLSEFAGKVNLIYIDPPFDTGADFSFPATVPDDPEAEEEEDSVTFTKEPSIIEHKAYRDIWGGSQTHLDAYLKWLYETAVILRELLSETGSIYVHTDWHVGHYVKLVLDEVFGIENFKNQIVWQRFNFHADANRFGIVSDEILFYTAGSNMVWNPQSIPIKDSYIQSHFRNQDSDGRRYKMADILAKGQGPARRFGDKVLEPPPGTHWRFGQEKIDELMKQGRIGFTKQGTPAVKMYLDEKEGSVVHNIWNDIPPVNPMALERVNFPTQKPEALLERIIKSSSNNGDIVLDCFCGSGTTAVVAEKLQRRWIACDLSRFAIHTSRKRLLSITNVRPFVVQNLGKYERQVWAGAEFGDNQAAERQRAYVEFILKLAQAAPLNGYSWLHGVKAGRMIHVGAVDAPVSVGDVTQIAAEFKRAVGTGKDAPKTNGVDVLGWDFAFELNEVAKQQAAAAKIQMRFLRIPRDVMDKRAVEQGDIRFFELGALSVEVKTNKRNVHLRLKDFVIPPDDVPEEARKAVKHWSQWIDYWAVDWDNKRDTFHNEWQTYRTRKDPSLQLEVTHTYAEAGEYTIVVKVIDILGNDTTKTERVKVV